MAISALKVLNTIPYISASRIRMWEKCKHQFYKKYIEPFLKGVEVVEVEVDDEEEKVIGLEDQLHFTFGKIVHGAIEDFWAGKARRKRDLMSYYDVQFAKRALTDQYYYELGVELMEDYFSYLVNDAPKRRHIASEIKFEFMLGDAKLVGAIDQVFYRGNGVYEIVDYKTNNWLPPQDEIDADMQLAMYDIAFREDPAMQKYWVDGRKPKAIYLTMHFLKHYPMHTEYSKAEREYNKRYIQVIHKQMQILAAEQFVATLNKFCTWCDFTETCSAYQDALKNDSLDFFNQFDVEDFSDRLGLVDEIKARMKILDKELGSLQEGLLESFKDTYGESDEVVKVGDREFFLYQGGRRNLNQKMVIEILEKHGLWDPMDWVGYLGLGKIEEMLRNKPEIWFKIERKAMFRTPGKVELKSRKSKSR